MMVGTLGTILAVGLNGKPYYIRWGWFQISAANLIVIVMMVLVFVLAIALPFPRRRR
jgi:bacteriorhodopsin